MDRRPEIPHPPPNPRCLPPVRAHFPAGWKIHPHPGHQPAPVTGRQTGKARTSPSPRPHRCPARLANNGQ